MTSNKEFLPTSTTVFYNFIQFSINPEHKLSVNLS